MSHRSSQSLPSSLELLLDTMCNTFGGIVFIAIALIIITQISSEHTMQRVHTPTQEEKEAQRQHNADVARQLEQLQSNRIKRILEKNGWDSNTIQIIKDIEEISQKLPELRNDRLNAQEKLQETKAKLLDNKTKKTESVLQDKIKQTEMLSAISNEKMQGNLLDKRIADINTQIEENGKKLTESQNKSVEILTFSHERSTTGYSQKDLYIRNGLIYDDDMVSQRGSNNSFTLVFSQSGNSVNSQVLGSMLANTSRNRHYVVLWVDNDSFRQLLFAKDYLRKNGYLTTWYYNPGFHFKKGSGHSASY